MSWDDQYILYSSVQMRSEIFHKNELHDIEMIERHLNAKDLSIINELPRVRLRSVVIFLYDGVLQENFLNPNLKSIDLIRHTQQIAKRAHPISN